MTKVKGAISFKHVSFGYNPERILIKDLSIDIPAGSKVAIVGPTGAGKSTLINLLMRFYPINSGDILLDGQSIYDYTRASLRQQFGMVLQETWLKQGTIHDNIAFGNPDASREQVIAAAKAANADFFIPTVATGIRYQVGKCRRISLCWASPALDHRPSLSGYSKDSHLRRGDFFHRYTDRSASTGYLCQTHEGAH